MEGVQTSYIKNQAPTPGTEIRNSNPGSGGQSPFAAIFQSSNESYPTREIGNNSPQDGNHLPTGKTNPQPDNNEIETEETEETEASSATEATSDNKMTESPVATSPETEAEAETSVPASQLTQEELEIEPPLEYDTTATLEENTSPSILAGEDSAPSDTPVSVPAQPATKVLNAAGERTVNPETIGDEITQEQNKDTDTETASTSPAPAQQVSTDYVEDPFPSIGILEIDNLRNNTASLPESSDLITLETSAATQKSINPAVLGGLNVDALEEVNAKATRTMPTSLQTLSQLNQGTPQTTTLATPPTTAPEINAQDTRNLSFEKAFEQAIPVTAQNLDQKTAAADAFINEWANAKPVTDTLGTFKTAQGMPSTISDIHSPTLAQNTGYGGIETGLRQFDLSASAARMVSGQNMGAQGLPSPTLNMGQQGWEQSFGKNIAWMINNGNHSAQIKISPAELGPVQIHLNMNQDQLNLQLNAQHQVTRETLEASIPRLREFLGDSGFSGVNVDVSSQQQTSHNNSEENTTRPPVFIPGQLSEAAPEERPQQGYSLRMLDTFA